MQSRQRRARLGGGNLGPERLLAALQLVQPPLQARGALSVGDSADQRVRLAFHRLRFAALAGEASAGLGAQPVPFGGELGACSLLCSLRRLMPAGASWRLAQFDTLRLRLIKLAARVVESKMRVKLHLPSACPGQRVLQVALDRLPRLACCYQTQYIGTCRVQSKCPASAPLRRIGEVE
jgi:hypothetical protein